MAKYIIHGGRKLSGTIEVNSAKNSAVAIFCASLMVRGKVTLTHVPRIEEVFRIIEMLQSIGVLIKWEGSQTVHIDSSSDLHMGNIDRKASEATRSSIFLLGALAHREKKYKIYKSGGCRLGNRTVKPHLFSLEKFGVSVISTATHYDVENNMKKAGTVIMYESGDTPTENTIMASVFTPGVTQIKFASSNYMVQDLCYFLNAAGAKIQGIGTTTLIITGVSKLKNFVKYPIMPDPIEAMSFISLAVTTHSEFTIANCPTDFLELELEKLSVMGQAFSLLNIRKSHNGKFVIADIKIKPSKLTALPDKIYGRPFPGLNIDNLPFFVPILTQAKGRTLVHDWVYENRAIYYLELQKLGAQITLLDPHRIFVEGSTRLKANELMCPPAIRPGMAVLIAMLAAHGISILRNSYTIERGYEDLPERLARIGAVIERVST